MSVSKTNRSASTKAQEALPSKDGSAFKKALKSASKKAASETKANAQAANKNRLGEPEIGDRLKGEKLDGERLKGEDLAGESKTRSGDNDVSSTENGVESGATEDSGLEAGQRELDDVSRDDVFSDEELMISPDGSWGAPAQGLAQPGAIITSTPATPAPPAQVMQQLVSAMAAEGWVGADIHGKKVVMLNVECPGRGSVRIRLRKEETGVSVRVRADNDELSGLLETHQDQLRDAMSKKGLALANLEVVS